MQLWRHKWLRSSIVDTRWQDGWLIHLVYGVFHLKGRRKNGNA